MAKKTPSLDTLSFPELGKALSEKWRLSNKYHSGELEVLRDARTLVGGMNWRILRYQRIIEPEKSFLPVPQHAYVTPKTFERQMKQLKKECRLVPLEELLTKLHQDEEIPDKTVAVTIDGGYMDTFLYGFPIIKDVGVPVSVFLPTGFVDTDNMFWADKVSLALLTLKQAGETIEPFEFFSDEMKEGFSVVCPNGEITFESIALMIAGLRASESSYRAMAVEALGQIFTNLQGEIPKEPTFLSWEEVVMMERFGVRFGSLGHRHAAYHELTAAEAARDVDMTFETLKERLQNPLMSMAAPEGVLSVELISLLHKREAGSVLLMDLAPDNFKFLKSLLGLRRVSIYEAMTKTPDLFFCRVWDVSPELTT